MNVESSEISAVAGARRNAIGEMLGRTARRSPQKTALVAGGQRWTYAEFDERVNRTANALAARGFKKGDRLALLSRNCIEYPLLAFATARLGVLLVPINFMLRPPEVSYILDDCEPRGLVVEDGLLEVAETAIKTTAIGPVRGLIGSVGGEGAGEGVWESVSAWSREGDPSEPEVMIDDDDPIRIMYTSGTESRPKGALLSSRALMAQYVSCVVDGGMSADDIDIHSMPMYHCAQLDCFIGPDVYLGATGIILSAPDPEDVLAKIEWERATKFFAPPTVWISLLRSPHFADADLSSLQKGYYGASPMPVEVLKEIQARMPGLRLWNLYGQTEMAPAATVLKPEDQLDRPGSAGQAAINVETKIVDEGGIEVPRGEIGEIVHRSPQATLGYWRNPEATAAAFADGWFHSGDLGTMDEEGYLAVVDRKKDMIKTGGENVSSREVEEVIHQMSEVAEVAVFGISDPTWVEAVTAAVVPVLGADLKPEDVIRHCRDHLAGYKTPKRVVLVSGLPKNPSGKILKRELRMEYSNATTTMQEATS
jgi:fatty-acyl-CoA synthase